MVDQEEKLVFHEKFIENIGKLKKKIKKILFLEWNQIERIMLINVFFETNIFSM